MTDLTNVAALAFKCQSSAGTYASPGTPDTTTCANLSWSPQAITAQSPEYTGTIHKAGDLVLGATYNITFDILIRGPGGSAPPTADAFILGRVLRTLGFTENLLAAAIPVASEALGVGSTTTTAVLGSSAAATADLYNGLALQLAVDGAMPAGLTMIRDYTAARGATIAETRGSAPTGNYQIPRQAAYTFSATGTPPLASCSVWQGNRRYNFQDMAPSSGRISFPVSTRDGGSDFPKVSVTFSGDLNSYVDEAAPAVAPTLALPPFKGGKMFVAGVPMGGSSLSLDLGLKVGFPPNPNKPSGNDPAQTVETRRSLTVVLNQVAKSVLDLIAAAQGQGYYGVEALYGLASGNYVGFAVTDARFNFPATQENGDFFQTSGDMLIDSADKTISLVFPYYP